ncbi:MAG: phage holin family protein [Clostridia bacterium]|nr:phage holin family protein [Clostridia bacterium]
MGAILARFLITVLAIPLCARFMDGVTVIDLTNALIVGAIIGGAYTLLRPLVRLVLSVINFCTLGLVSVFVDAWFIQLVAGLVPESVTFASYWWALAIALAINAARMMVDIARGDHKRK